MDRIGFDYPHIEQSSYTDIFEFMTKSELNELEKDIEEALDELDYDIPYETDSYIEIQDGVKYGICEVEFDVSNFDDAIPDNWDEDAEDAIADVVRDWDGSYYWDDHTIIVSV